MLKIKLWAISRCKSDPRIIAIKNKFKGLKQFSLILCYDLTGKLRTALLKNVNFTQK